MQMLGLATLVVAAAAVPLHPPMGEGAGKEPAVGHGRIGAVARAARERLPSLRERAAEVDAWSQERQERVVGRLMREQGADVWLISQREYNEDPVFFELSPETQFSARRRTVTVFALSAGSDVAVRRDFVGLRQGEISDAVAYIADLDPETIAINVDSVHAFSDGWSMGERQLFEDEFGPELTARFVSRPRLALDFLTTRVDGMRARYTEIMTFIHDLIAEAISAETITPGETTTSDVQWYFRDQLNYVGLEAWFFPSFDFSRNMSAQSQGVIMPGDILWMDIGCIFMGLATDTQHMGYVLRDDETEVPAGIAHGLTVSNRMQDIHLEEMVVGRTGNEILANILERLAEEGIDGTIYSHPTGGYGHGPGATIGLWDQQDGVPFRGDVDLLPDSWYSIELQANVAIPEWNGRVVSFRQEEDAMIDGEGRIQWALKRQDALHVVV